LRCWWRPPRVQGSSHSRPQEHLKWWRPLHTSAFEPREAVDKCIVCEKCYLLLLVTQSVVCLYKMHQTLYGARHLVTACFVQPPNRWQKGWNPNPNPNPRGTKFILKI
jgi:hypothetical protein